MIADDQRMFSEGLHRVLSGEADMRVVGSASDGDEVLKVVGGTESDIVVMDIRMPRLDGIEAAAELMRQGYAGKIVLLSGHASSGYLSASLTAGVAGYLLKSQHPAETLGALRCAAAGAIVLAPAIFRLIESEFSISVDAARVSEELRLSDLSRRELDVLRCISRGLSNDEIAQELVLCPTTVKSHVTRLLRKLGVRDRLQAAILARNAGFRGAVAKMQMHAPAER